MKRPKYRWLGRLRCLHRGRLARLRGSRARLRETRTYDPTAWQEVLVNGYPCLSGVSVPFGERGDRTVGARGASAPSVPCHSDPAGFGLRARDSERGGSGFLAATSGGLARETRSFLQATLRSLARVVGQTLYARREGMRGRLRWFTPSRPARELKTAEIGKGQGGSTQPIRC
jgi:hypothetical protein